MHNEYETALWAALKVERMLAKIARSIAGDLEARAQWLRRWAR